MHAPPVLFALAMLAAPRPTEIPREPGVWWENSVSMAMSGFSAPPRTDKVCVPVRQDRWAPPEEQGQQGCKLEDLKRSGKKTSWTMVCAGGIRSQGEITWSGDSYTGTQTMTMPMGEARMTMTGRKVGGDCDANEIRRQVAGAQQPPDAQALAAEQAERAEGCERALREMDSVQILGLIACKEKTAAFCARWQSREGFGRVEPRSSQEAAAEKLCGKTVAAVLAKLCRDSSAEHGRSPTAAGKVSKKGAPGDAVDPDAFLARRCPAEARPFALRECAGRSYTGMEERTRAFCTEFVRARLDAGESVSEFEPARAPAASPKSEAVEQGKKILKGFFGR